MRVAFCIVSVGPSTSMVRLFVAADMQDGPAPLAMIRDEEGVAWSTRTLDGWMRRLMTHIEKVEKLHGGSALKLVRALVGLGAKQVVWDNEKKKYRNLSTAADAPKVWTLTGTSLTVEAKDEAEALKRAPARIAAAMDDAPDKAHIFARWFTSKKVEAEEGGAVPEAIPVEALALPNEKGLAKLPIPVLKMKEDEKEG